MSYLAYGPSPIRQWTNSLTGAPYGQRLGVGVLRPADESHLLMFDVPRNFLITL